MSINVTGIHLLDLQLQQDKNCMKNKQFNWKKGNHNLLRYGFIILRYDINSTMCIAIYRYIVTPLQTADIKVGLGAEKTTEISIYHILHCPLFIFSHKGVYMVYILNRPLFSAISKIFQRQKIIADFIS